MENSTLLIGSLIEGGGLTTISVDTVFVLRQLILKFISWTKSGVVGLWSRIWVIKFFFWVKTVPSLFQLQNSMDVKGIAFTSLMKMTLVSSTLRIRRLARL